MELESPTRSLSIGSIPCRTCTHFNPLNPYITEMMGLPNYSGVFWGQCGNEKNLQDIRDGKTYDETTEERTKTKAYLIEMDSIDEPPVAKLIVLGTFSCPRYKGRKTD